MKAGKKTHGEEDYFAQQEIQQKKRLATEIKSKLKLEEQKKLKELHYMHCPKCGMKLDSMAYRGVVIDKCHSCGVIVLDNGELEKIAGKEGSFFTSFLGLFK